MRFGISATSSIFPKNFLTRFRPINVCAIISSRSIEPSDPKHRQSRTSNHRLNPAAANTAAVFACAVPRQRGDQDDSPEGRNPSRPSGQAFIRRVLALCISVLLFNDSGTRPNRRNATPHQDLPHSRQPQETAPAVLGPYPRYDQANPGHPRLEPTSRTVGNPAVTPPAPGLALSRYCLLKLNLCADLFELRLDLGSIVLV